jgi:peptide/nickel transport system substrate-binding protein
VEYFMTTSVRESGIQNPMGLRIVRTLALAAGISLAMASGARADTPPKAAAGPAPSGATAGDLKSFVTHGVADAFNPRAKSPGAASATPRRGGVLRMRSPTAFDKFNPILTDSRDDIVAINYMIERPLKFDEEALEYRPRLAWTWEIQDLIKKRDAANALAGVILQHDDKQVVFVPGAARHTFLKNDLASYTEGDAGTVTLKPERGGATLKGSVEELETTLIINTAVGATTPALTLATADLSTYRTNVAGKEVERTWVKPFCFQRFRLRPGVVWEDSVPLTAADWLFTMDIIMNPKVKDAAPLRSQFTDLEAVRAGSDSLTVEFIWAKPYFKALEYAGETHIVPRHIFKPEAFAGDPVAMAEAFTKHEYSRKPIGCGMYKLVQNTTEKVVLERNPLYYGQKAGFPWFKPEMPYLDRLEWTLITNRLSSLKELQAGSIDLDADVEPDTWVSKDTNSPEFTKDIVRAEHLGQLFTYVSWNTERPWFKDKRVRQALGMLIPAERVAKDVHHAVALRINGPFFMEGPVYDKSRPLLEYNPQKAKRLLREAGWLDRDKDGIIENEVEVEENGKMVKKLVPFEFEFLAHSARAYHAQFANIVKDEFAKVGIKANVRVLEFATFSKTVQDRNFDACRFAMGATIDTDPFTLWHSSQAVKGGQNYANFRNPAADALLERGREEFDPKKRWGIFRELDRIIAEEQPVAFMFGFPEQYFYSAKFRGVKLYPSQYVLRFEEWWKAEN